ncbi:MAG: LysM peptidoglycan-binding domain-containing protein [Clostridiales bacterium]|nr:LysM peptidoglycan-binding domain-containing protein [Clostridiales bacterium]
MFYFTIKPGDTIYELAEQYNLPVSSILSFNPGISTNNLIPGQQILIPIGLINPAQYKPGGITSSISLNELNLRNTMRRLWEEHIAWTRMAILSAASDSPDFSSVTERLLRNPKDMAEAIRPLYGEANASTFDRLMTEHLKIASQLVGAAKEGNTQAAQNYEKQWYANADRIADFLSMVNPYINRDEMKNMLYSHLALTKQEAAERLNKNYAMDIALFDQIQEQALSMADFISGGIVKQFPDLFR